MEFRSRKHKAYVYRLAEFCICEAFEEAHLLDLITQEERDWLYSLIGNRTGLLGLLPRRPDDSSLFVNDNLQRLIERRIRGNSKENQTIMHTCSIVHVKPGHEMPGEIRKLMLTSTKQMSCAVIDTDMGIVDSSLSYDAADKENDLATLLVQMDSAFKEQHRIFAFQTYSTGEIHPDDVQPFTLLETDVVVTPPEGEEDGEKVKRPCLVAFIDGPFIGYHQPASAHSNAFFAFNKVIKEEINDILTDKKADFDALLEEMSGKRFQRSMQQFCSPSGVILFASGTGKVFACAFNDKAKEFPWGWLSSEPSFDQEGKDTTPHNIATPAKTERKLTPAERFRAGKSGEFPVTTADKVGPPVTTATAVTDAITIDPNTMVKMPEKMKNRSQGKKHRWYRKHFGKDVRFPKDLNAGLPYHMLVPDSMYRVNSETALRAALLKAQDDLELDQDDDDAADQHTPPEPVKTSVPPTGKVVQQPLMLISPKEKAEFKLKADKYTLVDPERFGIEADTEQPTFLEQTGCKFEDVILWDDATLIKFCTENPLMAAIYLRQLHREIGCNYDKEFIQIIRDEYKKRAQPKAAVVAPKKLTPAELFKQRAAAGGVL